MAFMAARAAPTAASDCALSTRCRSGRLASSSGLSHIFWAGGRQSLPAVRGGRSGGRQARGTLSVQAAGGGPRGPFRGVYGTWSITDADVIEVLAYRAGLSVMAAAFCAGTTAALLPPDLPAAVALQAHGTLLAATGAAGLGVSLTLIHIYVTPLKRLLQALAAVGVAGGTWLAATQPEQLPSYVADHPGAVWLVGPLFAALTGVAVKEGICYGKAEAFALALLVPILTLGHLSGLAAGEPERGLAVAVAALLALFAARKYTQDYKDDIGDGSVFAFYKLTPEEQQAKIDELQGQSMLD